MKAQVLNKYDDDLTASSWVDMQDVPDPKIEKSNDVICLLYTSPSPRDRTRSRMPSSA